jgi:hypothetical protein
MSINDRTIALPSCPLADVTAVFIQEENLGGVIGKTFKNAYGMTIKEFKRSGQTRGVAIESLGWMEMIELLIAKADSPTKLSAEAKKYLGLMGRYLIDIVGEGNLADE